MKYLFFTISFFVLMLSFSATQGSGSGTLRLAYNSTSDSTIVSVRKGVFFIKGKQVDRQTYFEYLKCKHYKGKIIGSSIMIGIGATAMAGSIPLFLRTNGFSGDGVYYGSGGVLLASLGAFGLGFGIPFTISNVKFYNKTKCKEQTLYLLPQLNGVGVAYIF